MRCSVQVAWAGHCGALGVVEEPDGARRHRDRFEAHSAGISTAAIDETVEGEVKQQMTIAAPWIGRAEPDVRTQWSLGIGSPWSFFVVGGNSHQRRQIRVPSVAGGNAVGCPVGRQPSAGIDLIKLGGDAPLLEV